MSYYYIDLSPLVGYMLVSSRQVQNDKIFSRIKNTNKQELKQAY